MRMLIWKTHVFSKSAAIIKIPHHAPVMYNRPMDTGGSMHRLRIPAVLMVLLAFSCSSKKAQEQDSDPDAQVDGGSLDGGDTDADGDTDTDSDADADADVDADADADNDSNAGSLSITIECAQHETYPNHVVCSIADISGRTGFSSCELFRNNKPVDTAWNYCRDPLTDNDAPNGKDIAYSVEFTKNHTSINGESVWDTVFLDISYEMPAVLTHYNTGGPGSVVSSTVQRADPLNPDGYDTFFRVDQSNLPAEAGGWVIDQSTGVHSTANPVPTDLDMEYLYLITELCVDYNLNGEVDPSETNCSAAIIDDFQVTSMK